MDNVSDSRVFHTGERNFADLVANTINAQRSIIDYMQKKYDDPVRSQQEDVEYIQKASAFLANKQECYNALLKLFE